MNMDDQSDDTLWALWLAQWQGVMRGSDILRQMDQKARSWYIRKETHIGRLKWESVDPRTPHGCNMRLRWDMKQTKTNQNGEKRLENSILVENEHDSLPAGAAIEHMISMRGRVDKADPLLLDSSTALAER